MAEISFSKNIDFSDTLVFFNSETDTFSTKKSYSPLTNDSLLIIKDSNKQLYRTKIQTIEPLKSISGNYISIPSERDISSGIILPEEELKINIQSWMTGIFVIVFILFAIVRVFYRNYWGQLLRSSFNNSESKRMFQEKSLVFKHSAFGLDMVFYLMSGIFLYQIADFFSIHFYSVEWINYFFITGGIIFFIMVKKILYFFMGYITRSSFETSEYVFNMNNYNRVLGLFLFPICISIVFIPRLQQEYLFIIGISIFIFLYFLLLFRGIKILLRKQFPIFYLILYLCSLEILPILYLYKLAMNFFLIQ
ncbi:MAG: DUF4271 domain-containing protein [Prolixibacteraceae bacterium]|nr:DUF4271 domain-containing protein [Prolixibacteraceae bacterium]